MKKRDLLQLSMIGVIGLTFSYISFFILQNNNLLIIISQFFIWIITFLVIIRFIREKIYWFEQILDHMPSPISVTDLNMKWTFINKPVEDFLKLKRKKVLGKHCSNWGQKFVIQKSVELLA